MSNKSHAESSHQGKYESDMYETEMGGGGGGAGTRELSE